MLAVLTIAGSDPSGGAGLQGDLATFAAHGVHGAAVPTALTVQDTRGVRRIELVDVELVVEQLGVLFEDMAFGASKTGMLASPGTIAAVATVLGTHVAAGRSGPLVVDPVLAATSGDALAVEGVEEALVEHLFPLARLVTPNLAEAARLVGFEVDSAATMERAGEALLERGARAVLVKGGHLDGESVVDLLHDGERWHVFESEKLDVGGEVHGTGCALAAAIASRLACGADLVRAVEDARAYVRRGIEESLPVGRGARMFRHTV